MSSSSTMLPSKRILSERDLAICSSHVESRTTGSVAAEAEAKGGAQARAGQAEAEE